MCISYSLAEGGWGTKERGVHGRGAGREGKVEGKRGRGRRRGRGTGVGTETHEKGHAGEG